MAEVKTNLRVLRPSRKKVRAGDVFAMQMPDDLYLFGRVISTDAVNIQPVGSRCVRSGVESPAYSAIVHPFFAADHSSTPRCTSSPAETAPPDHNPDWPVLATEWRSLLYSRRRRRNRSP
jgi:hypothetical protein